MLEDNDDNKLKITGEVSTFVSIPSIASVSCLFFRKLNSVNSGGVCLPVTYIIIFSNKGLNRVLIVRILPITLRLKGHSLVSTI